MMTERDEASAYPPGSVRVLIESDLVTPATREALVERLRAAPVIEPRFFTADEFALLKAACDRLLPQPERARPVDIAGTLDTRMAALRPAGGGGDGWRYAIMPPDTEMHRQGLATIRQVGEAMFERAFVRLSDAQQDAVLESVQGGGIDLQRAAVTRRYFEELLAQVADIYYSHPLASEEIGYVGMADAHGWQAVGLDEREAHEPASESALKGAA